MLNQAYTALEITQASAIERLHETLARAQGRVAELTAELAEARSAQPQAAQMARLRTTMWDKGLIDYMVDDATVLALAGAALARLGRTPADD